MQQQILMSGHLSHLHCFSLLATGRGEHDNRAAQQHSYLAGGVVDCQRNFPCSERRDGLIMCGLRTLPAADVAFASLIS